MPTLYERYNQKYQSSMSVYGVNWRAMTFTVGTVSNNTQFYLWNIKIFCYRQGRTPGTATVGIYATSGGLPTGAALATGTFNANTIPVSNSWVSVMVNNPNNPLLSPSTKYAIVVSLPTGDASNNIVWKQNSLGGYAGGNRCNSANSGGTWASGGSVIEMFEVYGGTRSLWHGKAKTAIPTNTSTYYNRLAGGSAWVLAATRSRKYSTSSMTGVLRNFRIKVDAAPGVGKTWTFNIWKTGSATPITVAITGAATTGADTTHYAAITTSDTLLIEAVPTTAPAIPTVVSWCIEFESKNLAWFQLHGASLSAFTPASTNYWCPLMGEEEKWTSVSKYHVMPIAGNLMNLYVTASAVIPALATITFTVEKNGVATALVLTLSAGSSAGSITISVAFIAGDKFNIKVNTTDSTDTIWSWSLAAQAIYEGDFICAHDFGIDSLATLYNAFALSYDTWTASEAGMPGISSAMTILNMYVVLENAPGASGTKTFTFRKNAADTTMTVTMASAMLVSSDTTHYQSIADYDALSMKMTYTGTPVGAHPCYSFRCRIPVAYEVYPQEILGIIEARIDAIVTHLGTIYTSTVPETLGLMEAAGAEACFQPTVNETLGLKDTVIEIATLQRTVNETLGLKETPVTYAKIQKTINETIGLLETVQATLAAGKQATVNEILGLKDTPTTNMSANRTVNEKIGYLDTTGRWATLSRTINETIGVSDVNIVTRKRQSTTTELLGLLEATQAILSAVKTSTVNETLGLLDTKTVTSGFVRIVPETLGIKDTPVTYAAKIRTLNEIIGFIENASAVITSFSSYLTTVNEIIGFKDTPSQNTKFNRTIPEIIGFMEITTNVGTFTKIVQELLGLKDTPSTGKGFGRTINETLGLIETASATLYAGLQVTVNEKLGFIDMITKNTMFQRTINEQLGLKDTPVIGVNYARTINELLGLIDTPGIKKWITVYEKLGFIDSASTIKNYVWTNFAYQFDVSVNY